MRIRQNIQALLILMLLLCPCSCEKSESDDRELFPNTLPIDRELLGEWHRSYNIVSNYTWITVYTDSIVFNSDNLGLYSSYKFRDRWFSDTFQFYTKDDIVFFKYEERKDQWTYIIRNDSLLIHGSLPFLR
jgi:hypothetical protein